MNMLSVIAFCPWFVGAIFYSQVSKDFIYFQFSSTSGLLVSLKFLFLIYYYLYVKAFFRCPW